MKIFYKPKWNSILVDLILISLNFLIIYGWFPLTTPVPFQKYFIPSLLFTCSWVLLSYLMQRYQPLNKQKYSYALLRLLIVTILQFIFYVSILHFFFKEYSGFVLLTVTIGIFCVEFLYLFFYFSYRFATRYDIFVYEEKKRVNAEKKPPRKIDEESYFQLCNFIKNYAGNDVLNYINKTVDLRDARVFTFVSDNVQNLKLLPHYEYSTFIYLKKLNDTQQINTLFSTVNEKLPDDGNFVCCFESKSTRKKNFLKRYPEGINYFLYSFDFLFKRVFPKIIVSRRIYHFFYSGKNRVLSLPEVLGRLYCLGFEVKERLKINGLVYVVSQRKKSPYPYHNTAYGPLIKLKRYGKNEKIIHVYKLRTMHPYSEYLQEYIYQQHQLQNGGKFNKDFRITTLGRFMRKYWLDELPMLINLFKGDLKLVGVRPLSPQYFNLYSKDLQELRLKYKPGLLPPLFADLPQTLEEIQLSELKYLSACEKNGRFKTDCSYFFKIINNILFKKVRGA